MIVVGKKRRFRDTQGVCLSTLGTGDRGVFRGCGEIVVWKKRGCRRVVLRVLDSAPLVQEIVVGGGVEIVGGLLVGRWGDEGVLRVLDCAPLVREIVVGEDVEIAGGWLVLYSSLS